MPQALAKQKVVKGQTPLMRQYEAIKARHPGTVLLFRMGDFYETFAEDARQVHGVLGITLTKRSNGGASEVDLAGFPYHSLDTYLPKLISAGFRVAICEQLEEAGAGKAIVKRDVVEVVTPGVSLREQLLDPKQSTWLAAVHPAQAGRGEASRRVMGISFVDASTGEFRLAEVEENQFVSMLQGIQPAEILAQRKHFKLLEAAGFDRSKLTPTEDWVFGEEYAHQLLTSHFDTHSLKGFGIQERSAGMIAAGAVLHYLQETQKGALPHIRKLESFDPGAYMTLDAQTRRNLELVAAMHSGSREGSLVGILDDTSTPMGGRLLRSWLVRPLRELNLITQRQDGVDLFYRSRRLREDIRKLLGPIGDLERMAARVCTGRAGPRDLWGLRVALEQVPAIVERLGGESRSEMGEGRAEGDEPSRTTAMENPLARLRAGFQPCEDISAVISQVLADDPPATLKEGGVIREGCSPELDEVRELATGGKDWLRTIQQREADRTGIPSLKIGFNKVFGYYIEITNAHRDKVPADYIRKQTLVNAERYITQELKEYEDRILGAQERMLQLEMELFSELRDSVASESDRIQANAAALALLDVFCSLAEVAVRNRYVRPFVDKGHAIEIENGRHPVVERSLGAGEPFVPNSIRLNADVEQILIITGPNMAGKSVILRQVGLIVLLAQIGSFVPADRARIGIVDRIFTRVGASDNMAAGESTFLVEMNETANILNNATPASLVLLDEVGRGTSTFDGLSIAWALVEYLHENPSVAARTLFATHYHELNALEERLERIRNYRVQVQEHNGRVIFLRKLVRGGADHSYGIEVARMAGLPEPVLARSREVLSHLEGQELEPGGPAGGPAPHRLPDEPDIEEGEPGQDRPSTGRYPAGRKPSFQGVAEPGLQASLFPPEPDPLYQELVDVLTAADTDNMTPMEALLMLARLRSKLREA